MDIDDADLKEFKSIIEALSTDQEANIYRLREILKHTKEATKEKQSSIEEIETPEEDEKFLDWKVVGKAFKDNFIPDFKTVGTTLLVSAAYKLKDLLNKAGDELKDIFTDAWDELSDVLDYSRLSNRNIREQAFEFGFTPAQNYAYSQTMEMMGLSSFDDLYYLTETQWDKFNEKFNEYSTRYQQLYDRGFFEDLEDFNWEMKEWREDIQYEFMEFFMNNKETISDILKFGKDVLEVLVKIADGVFKFVDKVTPSSTEKKQRQIAEIMGITNNSITNNTKNNTVTFSPTFNGVSGGVQGQLNESLVLMKEQILPALN